MKTPALLLACAALALGVSIGANATAPMIDRDAVITGTFNQFDYQEDSVAFLLSEVLSTLNQLPPLEAR